MLRLVCSLLLCLVMPVAAHAQASEKASRQVLVLGRVSDDPKSHAEALQSMLDYVVPRMRNVGIREGHVLMARDASQMQSYLRRGRVNWVSDTAVMALEYQRLVDAELLLATERGGGLQYHTVFFTWRDSGITSLDDLRGRSIAFQNTYSTSSFVLPAAELLRSGLGLDVLLSPLDRAAPERVGYVFARREGNVAAWVQKRLVDAGAFSNLDWRQMRQRSPRFAEDLRVFHETTEAPRAIELVSGDLDPAVRERLREVLLEAGNDPEAQPALQKFFGTRRFIPLDAGIEQSLKRLRGDLDLVRERLE